MKNVKKTSGTKNSEPVQTLGARKKSGSKNGQPGEKMGALGFEPRSAGIHM